MSGQRLLDLGVDDVHVDSAGKPPMATPVRRVKRKAKANLKQGELPLAKKKSRLRKMALMIDHPQHGRIEVYRMADKELTSQPILLQGQSFDSGMVLKNGEWIQLAKQGRFYKDGSFFEIDDRTVTDIITNFEATQNKKIPVDFEHASELKGSDGSIPMLGAPAQGWVNELQKRGKQLWGKVEWGDLAKEYIKDGKYKFISPAIRFGTKDTHTGAPTGAKLTSAGLVNIPFLDGMKPLTAKDAAVEQPGYAVEVPAATVLMGSRCFSMDEYMPRLKGCLKMGELSTPMECKDQLDRVREHYMVAGGSTSSMGTDISGYMMSLRDAVGANAGMSWDDVFDLVDEMIDEAVEEHEARYHDADEAMSLNAKDEVVEVVETKNEPEAVASVETTKPEATASTDEERTMSETKAIEVQLKDAITESATLTVQLKDANSKATELDTTKTKLELQLKEATAALDAVKAELVTLKDAHQKRVDTDLAAEVDAAVAAYGKTKGVVDADKPALLKLLKADPESFRTLYKPVTPGQATLLKDITSAKGNSAVDAEVIETPAAELPSQKTLIAKFTAEGKTLDEAVSMAFAQVKLAHAARVQAQS
jgi:Mu-like prophage I protein